MNGTSHTGGVTLMVAPRTGKARQRGYTVGDYLGSDLACSLYVRGKKAVAGLARRPPGRLTLEEGRSAPWRNLTPFIGTVTAP